VIEQKSTEKKYKSPSLMKSPMF